MNKFTIKIYKTNLFCKGPKNCKVLLNVDLKTFYSSFKICVADLPYKRGYTVTLLLW